MQQLPSAIWIKGQLFASICEENLEMMIPSSNGYQRQTLNLKDTIVLPAHRPYGIISTSLGIAHELTHLCLMEEGLRNGISCQQRDATYETLEGYQAEEIQAYTVNMRLLDILISGKFFSNPNFPLTKYEPYVLVNALMSFKSYKNGTLKEDLEGVYNRRFQHTK